MKLLQDLRAAGKTVLVVHHDLQTVREYFDMLILLNMRLVAFGPTEQVFTPELLQKTYGGRLTILADVAEAVAEAERGIRRRRRAANIRTMRRPACDRSSMPHLIRALMLPLPSSPPGFPAMPRRMKLCCVFARALFDSPIEAIDCVVWAAILLGATCGLLGSFIVLRRQSLLGDAIGHAVLPGVCIAFRHLVILR